MVNYKEILRLAAEGTNQWQIVASVRSLRNKVNEVITAAQAANMAWPPEESVTNEQLESILFPDRRTVTGEYLEPDFAYIHAELAKPEVTLTLRWTEYVNKAESLDQKPYMTTQFGDKYRA